MPSAINKGCYLNNVCVMRAGAKIRGGVRLLHEVAAEAGGGGGVGAVGGAQGGEAGMEAAVGVSIGRRV